MQWKLKQAKEVLRTVPFNVQELSLIECSSQKALDKPYHRLAMPDWANVVGITKQNELILIEQTRVGPMCDVLELPGGVIDEGEKEAVAAKRELEEETGYTSDEDVIYLGAVNPNPAFSNNSLHMFVLQSCYLAENRKFFPDENEKIQTKLVSFEKALELCRDHQIGSALAQLTILQAKLKGYLN